MEDLVESGSFLNRKFIATPRIWQQSRIHRVIKKLTKMAYPDGAEPERYEDLTHGRNVDDDILGFWQAYTTSLRWIKRGLVCRCLASMSSMPPCSPMRLPPSCRRSQTGPRVQPLGQLFVPFFLNS
jgi:hypothetical protein